MFAKFKNIVHSLELLGVSPGSKISTRFLNIAKNGSVAVICLIYLNSVLYAQGKAVNRVNPFSAGTAFMLINANRLDPGQPPSNSVAGLRSNPFATQSTIPHKNKQNSKVFKKHTTI